MTRVILFDTETTGLEPRLGHRVIEIAALELVNDLPTGRHFHVLIDPQREIPDDATRVHGITAAHLHGKPQFQDVVAALLEFFGEGPLLAHNAPFDFNFLNAEFKLLDLPPLDPSRMIDTLALAKDRFPGLPNSLDALCRRFSIDLSARTTHSALLDCRLLAEVYVGLIGGRQRGLALESTRTEASLIVYPHASRRAVRLVRPSLAELSAHTAFLSYLREPVWSLGVLRPVCLSGRHQAEAAPPLAGPEEKVNEFSGSG